AEVARALGRPTTTLARQLADARRRIGPVDPVAEPWCGERLEPVLATLYLLFNEGYDADDAARAAHAAWAMALAGRLRVRVTVPARGLEPLLPLSLFHEARRPSRCDAAGARVSLTDQDRARWQRPLIDEGGLLLVAALAGAPAGPYALQAAIAAAH